MFGITQFGNVHATLGLRPEIVCKKVLCLAASIILETFKDNLDRINLCQQESIMQLSVNHNEMPIDCFLARYRSNKP